MAKKWIIVWVIMLLVLGSVVAVLFFTDKPNNVSTKLKNTSLAINQRDDSEVASESDNTLSNCSGKFLTVTPVDLTELESITPLGNLAPPDHSLPTEHMYFNLSQGNTGVSLRAPGDITIDSVSSTKDSGRGIEDYSLNFSLCDDIHGYFIHIKTITNKLADTLIGADCNTSGQYTNCDSRDLSISMDAGEKIGTVGNAQQSNFDLGAWDDRIILPRANPDRYSSRSPNIICPLDIFSSDMKNALYNKVDRTASPICGEVAVDVNGTLQGNWVNGDIPLYAGGDWTKELAFVPDNFDPAIAVISIGGTFTDAGRWPFTPNTDDGLINRLFSGVTADGNVYCYVSAEQTGRIVLQMTSATELQIEKQSGDCGSDHSLISPTTYNR